MPTITVPSGTSGAIQIYDDGSANVKFSAKFQEPFYTTEEVTVSWAYTLSGVRSSERNAKLLDSGYQTLGEVFVAQSQTMIFHLGTASSPKLGGPLDHSFYVSRADTQGVGSITVGTAVRRGIPYVNVNGVWKKAEPYVKINGEWKQTT